MYNYWKNIVGIVLGIVCIVGFGLYAQLTVGFVEKKTSIDQIYSLSTNLLNMHILLSKGYVSLAVQNTTTEQRVFSVIDNLKKLSLWDVSILEGYQINQRKNILSNYIGKMESSLNLADYYEIQLNDQIDVLQEEMSFCEDSKIDADKKYFEYLDSSDAVSLPNSLTDIVKYGTCTTEKRIYLNAKKLLRDKLTFYQDIVNQKYNFLNKNQEMIVKYYDLFEDKLLEDLLSLKKTLQDYDF